MAKNDTALALEIWDRYCYVRDRGHNEYVTKSRMCEDFFVGLQWDPSDLALLRAQRRPALTINKIISTLSNVMGEQIYNRTQIGFQPRENGATQDIANALTKVFMQISEANQLEWLRSDVFADGIIGSRGFYDVRLGFSDNLQGQVEISQLNPRNVLIDPDAEEYDPDEWGDVITTKWMSPDMIGLLYSEEAAKTLEVRTDSYMPYGSDSIERIRERFGTPYAATDYHTGQAPSSRRIERNIRVVERQYKKLTTQKHFVDVRSGETRPIPDGWNEQRIGEYLQSQQGMVSMMKKRVQRIRWTVIADTIVLHDDWSPYNHFTVVPYFPFFRRGRTVGIVENLLGPQELLNKVSSQELHVVNTTANSGWKIKAGALKNMTPEELEQRGAQTGVVLELDDIEHAEKITPNQVPTGLANIAGKAEEHIKTVSGVPDYATGFVREDVSGRATEANQKASVKTMAKVLDNLVRTDWILARNILDCVQNYYAEERLIFITKDRFTGEQESVTVNQPTPEGTIANDLTLGEYVVVVSAEPERDSYEDNQFDQAAMMRKDLGVQIPDSVLIESSKLRRKHEIAKDLAAQAEAPEQQFAKALGMRKATAEVSDIEASASKNRADAAWKVAKAKRDISELQNGNDPGKVSAEFEAEMHKINEQMKLERYKAEQEFELERWKMQEEMKIKAFEAKEAAKTARAQAVMAAANQPQGAQPQ